MDVELKIQRFDPEKDTAPHWETYRVPVEPMDRVLDVLTRAKELLDGSITFRRSCAHGVCGSDALLINGRNRLACKVRVEQLGKSISVAPLPGLPVVKDLVVDMDEFFGKYRSVLPFLVADEPEGDRGAAAVPRAAGRVRRHHQVHPLRRLHELMPKLLGATRVRWPCCNRQRAPIHL